MTEQENRESHDSTQYIKSSNMSRTDDNRLRNTKREDPMNADPATLPDGSGATSSKGEASTEEGPSCAL